MIPNISRGGSTLKLARYLLGKGRHNEHKSPHLVGGSPELSLLYGGRELSVKDAGELARFIDEPMEMFGVSVTVPVKDADGRQTTARRAAHVWHTSLTLHPDDPAIGDGRWGEVVERFMTEMKLIGQDEIADVRWVAVHHGQNKAGSDHVHLAVNLVREDGTVANVHNDRSRSQKAALLLRGEYGFRGPEGPARGAGERGIKKGELESDLRRGLQVGEHGESPERGSRRLLERAVRACAAAAHDEAEFVARLRDESVLVRPYFEKGSVSRVAGYSVALRPTDGERPVWYGGLSLSRELSLPRLRQAWPALAEDELAAAWRPSRQTPGGRVLGQATSEQVQRVATELSDLRARLGEIPVGERGTWAQLARESAGVLAAASLRLEPTPGPIAEASREVARSGQLRSSAVTNRRWQSLPPTRNAAQLLLTLGAGSRFSQVLVAQLVEFAAALREMHEAAGELERARQLVTVAERDLAIAQPTRHDDAPAADTRLTLPLASHGDAARRIGQRDVRPRSGQRRHKKQGR